ncbi:MAG: carboxypeptidase-like regulatory domain-containing protein, partial [bacterium]|nr:carboxypeptidase-like regulatory domain-containing protein [bacterium]
DVQQMDKLKDPDEYIDGSGNFLSYQTFDLKIIPNRDEIVYGKDPDLYWMRSNISWGHRECDSPANWTKDIPYFGPDDVGSYSPKGPAFHDSWNDEGETASDEHKWYSKSGPSVTNSGYTIPKVGLIEGRVTVNKDGRPVAGATVKVIDRYRSATTDIDGRYKIALPAGSYQIQAGKSGYGNAALSITLNSKDTIQADFVLGTNYISYPEAAEGTIDRVQAAPGVTDEYIFVSGHGVSEEIIIKYGKTFIGIPEPLIGVDYESSNGIDYDFEWFITQRSESGCKITLEVNRNNNGGDDEIHYELNWQVSGIVKFIKITGKVVSNNGYKLEYGKGDSPTTWTTIKKTSASVSIIDGLLGDWDIEGLSDGRYSIRLVVDGKDEDIRKVTIKVEDPTPPSKPVVTDDGDATSDNTKLHAEWSSSSDTESGIAEYQYAIGTTSGGTDVVGWTSTGTTTEVTKSGLTLTWGQTYYFAVKAKNGAGLWSEAGISNGITITLVDYKDIREETRSGKSYT